jgi:hypothetical protein
MSRATVFLTVPLALIIWGTAKLLADDLLDHALERQAHRQPRDLLDDAQQFPPDSNSWWISARMVSVGDTRGGHGCRAPS